MSKPNEPAAIASYAVGFILCLLLTAIPYFLVVNGQLATNHLVSVIMGFALLQGVVQIFFFLHLGRGPKPRYNVYFFVATFVVILIVTGGSVFIMNNLHYHMSPGDTAKQLAQAEGIARVEGTDTGACPALGQNYQIVIVNGTAEPTQVQAKWCDTLTFSNQDSVAHSISFGTKAQTASYAGHEYLSIRKGQSETITLNQTGKFGYFDNQYPDLSGVVVVRE